MKKIFLFIVNVDHFFISHRLPIALKLIQQGHEVHIGTSITDHYQTLSNLGFKIHPLKMFGNKIDLFSLFSSYKQLLNLFKSIRPDILHLVTIKPVILGGIAAQKARVPSVVSAVSGLGFMYLSEDFIAKIKKKIVNILYKISFNHPNQKIIFQNQSDLDYFRLNINLASNKSIIISGSGVSLSKFKFQKMPRGAPLIIMASRMLIHKGLLEFVDAARILKKKGINAKFILVGEPDTKNPASINMSQIDSWVKEGIVEYWGWRTDMHNILPLSSIVVLPSYREGFPKILIEAAAIGRPIVTTDVPGCRDAIIENKTGLLVPVRDYRNLCKSIEKLLNNPILMKEMGYRGRELAECKYDINKVVSMHLDIYSGLMEKINY